MSFFLQALYYSDNWNHLKYCDVKVDEEALVALKPSLHCSSVVKHNR